MLARRKLHGGNEHKLGFMGKKRKKPNERAVNLIQGADCRSHSKAPGGSTVWGYNIQRRQKSEARWKMCWELNVKQRLIPGSSGSKERIGYYSVCSELFRAEENSNPAQKSDPRAVANTTLVPMRDTERPLDWIQFNRQLAALQPHSVAQNAGKIAMQWFIKKKFRSVCKAWFVRKAQEVWFYYSNNTRITAGWWISIQMVDSGAGENVWGFSGGVTGRNLFCFKCLGAHFVIVLWSQS